MNKGLLKVARYLAAKGFYEEAAQVKKLAGWKDDLKAQQRADDIEEFVSEQFGSFEGEGDTEGTHKIIGREGLGKTHPDDAATIDMQNMVEGFEELEKNLKQLFDMATKSAIRNDQLGIALGPLSAWCQGCFDALKLKQGWIAAPRRPMYTKAECKPYNMDESIPMVEKTTRDILDEAAQKDSRMSRLIEVIQAQVEGLNEMMAEM